MEIPPPNPQKMLDHWMDWEKGEIPPGDLMKQLKMGGMRELLESMIADETTDDEVGTGTTVGDLLDG